MTATLLFAVLAFALYMFVRNNWTYRQQSRHISLVHQRAIAASELSFRAARGAAEELRPSRSEMNAWMSELCDRLSAERERDYQSIASYARMLARFWCWDVREFAVDREAFDRVWGGEPGDASVPPVIVPPPGAAGGDSETVH